MTILTHSVPSFWSENDYTNAFGSTIFGVQMIILTHSGLSFWSENDCTNAFGSIILECK